ncbi:MAG: ribosome biogenesis GTPase Der [Zetaproteobacteria bacterium]|nr:MAG: ribosome biogenesis GTPase Der [Zetaproteobacteria bacterium]
MLKIAIVGRPNVGKSTLFNKLAGKKLAIVDNTPGVTRDWREAEATLFGQEMIIIDTAGLEETFDDSIQGRMRQQTNAALDMADLILFIIDGREGVTPTDEHFAAFLRKQKKPIVLAVNKCESNKVSQSGVGEAYSLGFGDPVAVSAEHSLGFDDLYNALYPYFPEEEEEEESEENVASQFDNLDDIEGLEDYIFTQEEDDPDKPIKIAIVGRPNVGKSTLLNTILNEQRVMTGPEAGITRDAIAVDWSYQGRKFKLVDTAGLRRRSKISNNIEKMSTEDSFRAIRLAQIVILVLDGNEALEKQDLQIAEHVASEGRALVIAVNKWDSVKNRSDVLDDIKHKLSTSLSQTKGIEFATISALNGKNIDKLFYKSLKTYEIWNKRVGTGGLNRWLASMESKNPAPLVSGRHNRVKYITQIKTRPPTFALWVSRPKELPESYRRYITNGLRRDFDIPSVPLRLLVRASKNPYAK